MLIGAQMMGAARGSCILDVLSVGRPGPPYGLRRLTASYGGKCINVRRDSDNSAVDIGFVGNGLDITTLLNFVGSGNGYVTALGCQDPVIGSAGDLLNANASGQPCIVSNGVLVTLNGKPALDFSLNSGAVLLNIPAVVCPAGSGPLTVSFVGAPKTITGGLGMYWMGTGTASEFFQCYVQAVSPYKVAPGMTGSTNAIAGGSTAAGQGFISTVVFGSTSYNYVNGALVASENETFSIVPGAGHLGYLQGSGPWSGYIQEFIICQSGLTTADRQTLEHNQESYYGISGS